MFDPYHKWLGIPREEQPPNHYRLLGLSPFESDPEVIDAAANRQMAYLQGCATGTQALLSQRLLNEVAAARLCLLTPEKKATYDARLRSRRPADKGDHAPTDLVENRAPTPRVRKNKSQKQFPILEGDDEEAEPHEIVPLPVMSRRPRASTKKRSRLPMIASILVSLLGVLVIQKFHFPTVQKENDGLASKVEENGQISNNNDRIITQNELGGADNSVETHDPRKTMAIKNQQEQQLAISTSSSPEVEDVDKNSTNSRGIGRVETGEVRQFSGHESGVMSVLFSPDNKLIISGSRDRSIRIWSVENGAEAQKLEGHEAGVWGLAITRDQRLLASCGPDHTVRIWDMATDQEIKVLRGHKSWVYCVAFSADGEFLLSGGVHSDDPTTRLWSIKTGREVHRMNTGGVVAFSPVGLTALSRGDGTLLLWDTKTRRTIRRFGGYPNDEFVPAIAFSPEGNGFLSAIENEGVVFYRDLQKGVLIKKFAGNLRKISSVAFCANGKVLAAGGTDDSEDRGIVSVWNVDEEQEIHCFKGHDKKVCSVAISSDGNFVVSGSEDGTVRLWRLH